MQVLVIYWLMIVSIGQFGGTHVQLLCNEFNNDLWLRWGAYLKSAKLIAVHCPEGGKSPDVYVDGI